MSRGFVKEDDLEHAGTDLPERPISAQINYVTSTGLAQLKQMIEVLFAERAELIALKDDATAMQKLSMVERDLRYFAARLTNAVLVEKTPSKFEEVTRDKVVFGAIVTIENEDATLQTLTIVGEDEANIAENKISWGSPLAKALIGQKLGDTVVWKRPAGDTELTIIAVDFQQ